MDLETTVDAILCLTVFELLNEPLATIESFHDHLPTRLLIFDYVLNGGHDLDTMYGVRQPNTVLDFVERRFEIVSGTIRRDDTVLTLAAEQQRARPAPWRGRNSSRCWTTVHVNGSVAARRFALGRADRTVLYAQAGSS